MSSFWQEFLRVQADRLLLLTLAFYLWHTHAPEQLVSMVIGGLLMQMQPLRFPRPENGNGGNGK